MNDKARDVLESKAVRDVARETFDTRLALIRGDSDEEGMGSRVTSSLGGQAKGMLDEALEIANHNRFVVAGTIGALVLWFFRNPIIAWFEQWLASENTDEDALYDEDDDDRDDPHQEH